MSEFKSEVKLDITLLYARLNRFLFELDQLISSPENEEKTDQMSRKFDEICELWRTLPSTAKNVTNTEPIFQYGIKIGQREKVLALVEEIINLNDKKVLKDRFLL